MEIMDCGCVGHGDLKTRAAEYQDGLYGHGKRAHNPTTKEGVHRCSVCGREHTKAKQLSKKEQREAKLAQEAEKKEKSLGRGGQPAKTAAPEKDAQTTSKKK
jgi:hypothetical protein